MPSCESGYTYPEPNNHRFVWGTCYAAHVATFDENTGLRRSVSPWMHTLDSDPVGLEVPLPVVAAAGDRLVRQLGLLRLPGDLPHRAIAARTWEVISPDLSTGDPKPDPVLGRRRRRQPRAVLRRDDLGDRPVAHRSRASSGSAPTTARCGSRATPASKWTDLTKNVNMPPWGLVRRIDSSHFDPGTAYMAVDYHLVDNRDPYLFKTVRLRPDVDAHRRRAAEGAPARLHAVDRREPASQGDDLRRHRPRVLLLARRRQDAGRSSRTSCRPRR